MFKSIIRKAREYHQLSLIAKCKCPICEKQMEVSECENLLCKQCDVIFTVPKK